MLITCIMAFTVGILVDTREVDNIFLLDNSTIIGLVYEKDFDALLVLQETAVSLFKLSVVQTFNATKLARFPATPDGTAALQTARLVNSTHFVYCGGRSCSLCDATGEGSCSQIFSRFSDDEKVYWISVVAINGSTFFVRGFVQTLNPDCLVSFWETVERGGR